MEASTVRRKSRAEWVDLIQSRMETENLGIRELAEKVGLSHPTVSEVAIYGRLPSFDVCLAFAKWLDISGDTALRLAGLLPPLPEPDAWVSEIEHKLFKIRSRRARDFMSRMVSVLVHEEEEVGGDISETKPRKTRRA